MIQLRIGPSGWGEAVTQDIYRLLDDVSDQLLRHLALMPHGLISVQPGDTDYPEVRYRASPSDPYVVYLSARGRSWSQYSYQFAHELCHILSGYERLLAPQNKWFHESLCELASIFVLRQMARTWQISPPYSNWASYSSSLASYASDLIAQPSNTLNPPNSFQEWLSLHEAELRINPYQRALNRLVAVRLLPCFEQAPHFWRTIAHLPDSASSFRTYLGEWASSCPLEERGGVLEITNVLMGARSAT